MSPFFECLAGAAAGMIIGYVTLGGTIMAASWYLKRRGTRDD